MSDETRAVQSAAGLKPGSNPEDPGGTQRRSATLPALLAGYSNSGTALATDLHGSARVRIWNTAEGGDCRAD